MSRRINPKNTVLQLFRNGVLQAEFAFDRKYNEISRGNVGAQPELLTDLKPSYFNPALLHKMPVRMVGQAFLGK